MRLALLCVLVGALALPASAAAARPLRLGFVDDTFAQAPSTAQPWLTRAVDSGAQVIKIPAGWTAPMRPKQPSDPADPAYAWASLDQAVRQISAAGLTPLLSFTGAPAWAEGARRPASAPAGTWRPSASAYRDFAKAVGRRYDGTYPDPLSPGQTLPKVTAFQPWNEPNLSTYLTPQWAKHNGHDVAESPTLYRNLLDAFYLGLKSVRPDATVVSAGTAPFGDPNPGGRRIMPVRFWRDVLCLDVHLGRQAGCTAKAWFDVFAHHPYSVGGPAQHALNADDVSVPDLGKLTRLVKRAVGLGTALPKTAKPLWITELSWDSSPPDPNGVPAVRQAHWLEQAFYELWKQGASVIT